MASVEKELGVAFHPDYRKFLLEASDVVLGTLEPTTISPDSGHTYLVPLALDAWKGGVPQGLLPIAEDNGNYYCMNNRGEVVYWSHDGAAEEKWRNLESWIRQVWIRGR